MTPLIRAQACLGLARLFHSLGWINNARAYLSEAEEIADKEIEPAGDYLLVRVQCLRLERLLYLPEIT